MKKYRKSMHIDKSNKHNVKKSVNFYLFIQQSKILMPNLRF